MTIIVEVDVIEAVVSRAECPPRVVYGACISQSIKARARETAIRTRLGYRVRDLSGELLGGEG